MVLISGCTTIDPSYVGADRDTFEALHIEYLAYVDANEDIDQDQKDRRHRLIDSWRIRIEAAEKGEEEEPEKGEEEK